MPVEDFSNQVRRIMGAKCGNTADLPEELVNTLCNLYYFAAKGMARTMGGLSDLQDL